MGLNLNPARSGEEGTDVPIEQVLVRAENIVCEGQPINLEGTSGMNKDWEQGFGLIYYRELCIKTQGWPVTFFVSAYDDSAQATMDEILDTLKFTNQTSESVTSNWKKFSNTEKGISIQYPKEFVTEDGTDDFVYKRVGEQEIQNAEYFHYCDGTYMPPTGKPCSGPFSFFGVQLHDYVVTQELVDSWGGELKYAKQTILNGKPAWVVIMCAATGCSTSIKFNHRGGTLSISFYNGLYSDLASPLFISESAQKILGTLVLE
jgi:hypothetical protein